MAELTIAHKAALGVVVLVVSFAAGRYSVNQPPSVQEKKTVDTQVKTEVDKDIHKTTKTTSKKLPNGTITWITEQTEEITSQTDSQRHSDSSTSTQVSTPKRSSINISGLVGVDPLKGFAPVYGLSAQKELLGPVTVGAFGLSNGTFGLSVGLNF